MTGVQTCALPICQARRLSASPADAVSPAGVPCVGDGTSGKRVQMIYAVASDQVDRYDSLVSTLNTIAGHMDAAVVASAAQTGGERHLRFVTNPDCTLNIAHVTLSATGDDNLTNTITELRAKGYNLSGRKYHAWVDANVYCGIGQIWGDETPGATNTNNSSVSYARSDNTCWDYAELHEVFHGLGAVQLGAPNTSNGWHCVDEYDLMCYKDAAGVTMRTPCPSNPNTILDCNHDDYFSTNPVPNSYLATHWNTADSPFLSSGHIDAPVATPTPDPTPTPQPQEVAELVTSGKTSKAGTVRTYSLVVGEGRPLANLVFTSPAGSAAKLQIRLRAPSGAIVASKIGRSPVRLSVGLPAGTWTYEVIGKVQTRFTLKVTYPIP